MDSQEALTVVESVLLNNRLSKLQRTVFCHAWNEQSYSEIARQSGYELGYVKQTGSQLWQLLSDALDEKVTKHNLQLVVSRCKTKILPKKKFESHVAAPQPYQATAAAQPAVPYSSKTRPPDPDGAIAPVSPICDWGDAVDVPLLFGRTEELTTLTQWIVQDGSRLVGLFGMGGMGKTSLAATLAQTLIRPSPSSGCPFEFVVWRSLRNAPPLSDVLSDLLQVLSQQPVDPLPTLEGQLRQLLHYLRRHRCLIILDNGETIMESGDHGGGYLPDYDGYGRLWRCIGESDHQSVMVLTSREKPGDFAAIEGQSLPVRSLRLGGLSMDAGQALLQVKGQFTGSEAEWQVLVDHYAGNPLALKMVAAAIQDVFGGILSDFLDCLAEGASVFGDIHDLLSQQFNRLSPLEQQVMYWLAIARKPISLSELRTHLVNVLPLGQLLEALTSLERRYLIDKATPTPGAPQIRFTLQPAVMEYVTERFIQHVCRELGQIDMDQVTAPHHFKQHPLIQAQIKDYIRETQTRLILKPVAERLLNQRPLSEWETTFRTLLEQLRQPTAQPIGYAGGNAINLLCHLGVNLTGWDFSRLTLWNAYLKGTTLHQVKVSNSNLSRSVFTETFSQVLTVAFSPDGSLLATGDVNHDIHLWQVTSGQPLLSLKMEEGWVWSVAFSPDGRRLASSANRTVNLWDVQSGTCLQTLRGYSDRVFSVAFSPDGQLLATGSEDHCVRVWEVRTGRLLHTLTGHTDEVRSVAFSPSGHGPLASSSFDGTVRLWDANSGKELTVLTGHTGWVYAVAFSPDGATLASGSGDRTVRLWSVACGQCVHILSHSQPVRTVAFSLNGRTLASGGEDRLLHIWNYHTGECLRVLPGHTSWVAAIAFSPDGSRLASSSEDQSVRLWDSRTHLCLKTLQGYSNGVWSVAYSPNGSWLASGSQDRTVRLWDVQTGQRRHSLTGHQSWVWSVAFHPSLPVLASSSEDGQIYLWDLTTQQCFQHFMGHRDAVLAVLFSPDGRHLISGSLDGTLRWWNLQTGACDRHLNQHQGGVWAIALSADGMLLASGSQDQTVRLWDTHSGETLAVLCDHQSWIRCVALSPDRQYLVSGSADGCIKLWRVQTGECLVTLAAHRGPVLSIAVTPNGTTFTSCGTDGWIRQWDLSTHRQLGGIQGHDRWVRCVTCSPDGSTLVSCSQDETIKLWSSNRPFTDGLRPQTLRIPRPYEGLAIAQVKGLTPAQRSNLLMLGAIEE